MSYYELMIADEEALRVFEDDPALFAIRALHPAAKIVNNTRCPVSGKPVSKDIRAVLNDRLFSLPTGRASTDSWTPHKAFSTIRKPAPG